MDLVAAPVPPGLSWPVQKSMETPKIAKVFILEGEIWKHMGAETA